MTVGACVLGVVSYVLSMISFGITSRALLIAIAAVSAAQLFSQACAIGLKAYRHFQNSSWSELLAPHSHRQIFPTFYFAKQQSGLCCESWTMSWFCGAEAM